MSDVNECANDVFHLCMKHKNSLIKIFWLGEIVDTQKKLKIQRCAIYLKKNYSEQLVEDLEKLRIYDAPALSIHPITHIQVVIERIGWEKTHEKQNPFNFPLVLKKNILTKAQNKDSTITNKE